MVDLGGAITVHLFATGFGLSVSRMLFKPNHNSKNLHLAERNEFKDIFAVTSRMNSTVFTGIKLVTVTIHRTDSR